MAVDDSLGGAGAAAALDGTMIDWSLMNSTDINPEAALTDEALEREPFESFLAAMVATGASDVYFIAGLPITYRASGKQTRTRTSPLMPADTARYVQELYRVAQRDMTAILSETDHDDDFSFSLAGTGRFRVNVFRQRGSLAAVMRVIPFGLPDPNDLHIPESVMRIADIKKGLVLVTGPAGAGKSTTLACMIDRMNHRRRAHIITMEDPIEYVHRHGTCIITQREIGTDVATYAEALRSASREAPDVLLVGEMRDPETISTAVTAAEMGQLVVSTLHTTGAAGSINRIVDAFPPNQQLQIRIQLAQVLRAIVSQQLVPTRDGRTVPAFEVMYTNPAIRNLIIDGKTHQIDAVIAAGGEAGMCTMDQSLFALVQEGTISRDDALMASIHQLTLGHRLDIEGL